MVYNTNDIQFVEFDDAQEIWRAETRSRRLHVRLASAFKESIRELAMGPRLFGKDTGRSESIQQSQSEDDFDFKCAGLDTMSEPTDSIAVSLNITKTVRFAEGEDLERVVIIPAREDEDDTFPEDISDYYMYDDSDDEEDVPAMVSDDDMSDEDKRACDFDRLVGFAASAVRRRRGVGAERMWAGAQY